MSDKEPLRITLEDLGLSETPAAPATPERVPSKVRETAEQAGQRVAGAVKESTAKVTQKVTDATTDAANRTAEAVREKVSEAIQQQTKATADAVEAKLRDIDWKGEVQKGAEGSLRWLGQRLEQLADRMRTGEGGPGDQKGDKPPG